MHKGATVYLSTDQGIVSARVLQPHRNRTVTLALMFVVDAAGNQAGPYLHQRARVPRDFIFTNPRAAAGLPGGNVD